MNKFCERFLKLENKNHKVALLLKSPDLKDKFLQELKDNFDNLYDLNIGVDFNTDYTEFRKYRIK